MWGIKQLHEWTRRIPLRWRLTIASLGLLTLLLSVLGAVILFAAEQTLNMNEADALWNEARLVTKSPDKHSRPFPLTILKSPAFPPGPLSPDLQNAAEALAKDLASRWSETAILSPEGTVLTSDNAFQFALPSITLSPTVVQKALANDQPISYVLRSDAQGNHQIIVLLPLVNAGHTVAVLQFGTIDQSGGVINTLRLILLIGALGAVSIATALTIPLVSAALHPLVDMERTSRLIAEGDLSLRLDTTLTDDEIGHLSRSFNQMVAQLETTFQRQKRFVADASHELRTPLTALNGSLEMLLLGADNGDKEASRRLVRGMYSEVKRMHRLVEDLLNLTRLDEGQLKLREDIVDVSEVIDKVYNQAQQLSQGQTIYREVALNTPHIRADADRLQQVLLNIIENALKFTPTDGRVALSAYYNEKSVIIEIQDNGKGIPPEDLPHVFDRFYRVDSSRSRVSKSVGGSGLGLAIAKELIEAQGGKITISSRLGMDTIVTIAFALSNQSKHNLDYPSDQAIKT
jgi:two-component system, OmpR family, sensor kinase